MLIDTNGHDVVVVGQPDVAGQVADAAHRALATCGMGSKT
jgi:hypothetical protein